MKKMVNRLYYFRLVTGREPSVLERLQNTGSFELDEEELKQLQLHKKDETILRAD